jgi:hypothetical protein
MCKWDNSNDVIATMYLRPPITAAGTERWALLQLDQVPSQPRQSLDLGSITMKWGVNPLGKQADNLTCPRPLLDKLLVWRISWVRSPAFAMLLPFLCCITVFLSSSLSGLEHVTVSVALIGSAWWRHDLRTNEEGARTITGLWAGISRDSVPSGRKGWEGLMKTGQRS